MASKKPLLSPIPESPEVFSSLSSPNSPKADALFTEAAGRADPGSRGACGAPPREPGAARTRGQEPRAAAAAAPGPGLPQEAAGSSSAERSELPGSLEPAAEFSKIVPDAEGDFDTSEYFQQGEETPCEKEAEESSSLLEKEELQGNGLTGLEILQQREVQEGAQRTECPQKDSVRGGVARRRRRSSCAFSFPPAENLGITGTDAAVCSYSVEEILSVPQPCRSRSSAGAEVRVRRSMRLSRDAASEGLAWVQLPGETPLQPPLPGSAPRARRTSSTSILAENIHRRQRKLLPLPAPGKENEGSAPAAAAPGRRGRRRSSLCEATAREMPWAPTQRRRNTNSGCGKDRSNQKHSEEAETPELQLKEVSCISDFLK
ncbi:CDCA2 protein, partial [Dryoscopus gambensis]|nr:CDCA2 protein [Dryoscopus gambensis]